MVAFFSGLGVGVVATVVAARLVPAVFESALWLTRFVF